jgi:hypothetical protein
MYVFPLALVLSGVHNKPCVVPIFMYSLEISSRFIRYNNHTPVTTSDLCPLITSEVVQKLQVKMLTGLILTIGTKQWSL